MLFMARTPIVFSLNIMYGFVVVALAFQNALGDFLVELYAGTFILAGASIALLNLNAVRTGVLCLSGLGACLLGIAVATHINGYNDPSVFSGLGLILLGAYFVMPAVLIWLSVYFAIALMRKRVTRGQ